MTEKMKLKGLCRDSFSKLERAERAFGIGSQEAEVCRARWSAFYKAYRLIYKETIDYYDII